MHILLPHHLHAAPRPFLSVATATVAIVTPAIMCRTSKAIAPRLAWAETTLGEWYWNELPQRPSPWHLGPDDDDEDTQLTLTMASKAVAGW